MAVRAASLLRALTKPFQNLSISNSARAISTSNPFASRDNFLVGNNVAINPVRNISFFNKLPADHIWKSVTSVSNAGKKKGRGKGRKRIRDLNRGQFIGVGPTNMLWPGLNAPVMQGRETVKQQKLPEDPERMAKLIKIRDSMGSIKRTKLSPVERGWSGAKMPGRSIGSPDPIGDDTFEGFDTKILEFRSLLLMNSQLGRTRKMSATVVTGNGKGLAGFATCKSREGQAALRKAKNRAGQKLVHFDLCNGHTVFHDFFTQFGRTKIFVQKKPEGYGIVGHRAIKAMCDMIGIKDLHAKVEGAVHMKHIIKAFFIGLLQQKSHQQLAEEKRLHLVEFRKENENFPVVVASPATVRKPEEVDKNEVLDYTRYVLDNRVMLKKKKWPPFYTKMPHYEIYLRRLEKRRNHAAIRLNLMAEHGSLKSFLNDMYPDEPKDKTES